MHLADGQRSFLLRCPAPRPKEGTFSWRVPPTFPNFSSAKVEVAVPPNVKPGHSFAFQAPDTRVYKLRYAPALHRRARRPSRRHITTAPPSLDPHARRCPNPIPKGRKFLYKPPPPPPVPPPPPPALPSRFRKQARKAIIVKSVVDEVTARAHQGHSEAHPEDRQPSADPTAAALAASSGGTLEKYANAFWAASDERAARDGREPSRRPGGRLGAAAQEGLRNQVQTWKLRSRSYDYGDEAGRIY